LQNILESKYHYQPSWLILIIMTGVIILGYLYSSHHSKLNVYLRAVFTSRFAHQLAREERALSHPVSVFLSANFLIITSLFILQVFSSGLLSDGGIFFSFSSFLLLLAAVICVYLIRLLALKYSHLLSAAEQSQENISLPFFLLIKCWV
jgi:hypothetical protein